MMARPSSGLKAAISRSRCAAGDQRHVAEADDGAVEIGRQRGEAAFQRGRQALGEFGVAHPLDRQFAERGIDRVGLVAEHRNDRPRPRGQQPLRATRATIGVPSISASSLFGPPIRRDWPAASSSAAIRGPGGFAGAALRSGAAPASARGSGRDGISASRPPLPIRMIPRGPTGRPATSRSSTQSKPLTLGERAQPGRPSTDALADTGRAAAGCRDRPACRNDRSGRRPRTTAAGITSRRSTIAEAPCTSRISTPCRRRRGSAAPARRPCASQRSSKTRRQPSAASRCSVTPPGLVEDAFLEPGQPGLDQRRPRAARRPRPAAAARLQRRPRRSARPPLPARRTG